VPGLGWRILGSPVLGAGPGYAASVYGGLCVMGGG
jgi:hypothetical protein